MTATDKMALNNLYDCDAVSTKIIVEFLKEENERTMNANKQLIETLSELKGEIKTLKDTKIPALERDMNNVKDTKIPDLEREMNNVKDTKIPDLEREMNNVKDTRIPDLDRDMNNVKDTKILALEREMIQVMNPAYVYQCAYQNYWGTDNAIITYDKLTTDVTSGGSNRDFSGGFNKDTGVFTVSYSGVWTVSYSISSSQRSGSGTYHNDLYLYLNGQRIEESRHSTYNYNSDHVGSLGGRTLHLRLEDGDTVTVLAGEINELYSITICFELAHID